MTTPSFPQLTVKGRVAELTLTAADGKPPTLDHATLDYLDERLAALESFHEEVRLVVIRSASSRFFCAGADIRALREINPDTIESWIRHGHRVFNRIENLPFPVIARTEGYALGGGLELALAADFIFATPQAQLAQTEAKLGFVSGWGGSWRLPHRVGQAFAREMFYTGRMVAGPEALERGLVDACEAPEQLDQRCARLAGQVEECSAISIREMKSLLNASRSATVGQCADLETGASVYCLRSPDTQQRVASFLNRKK